MSQPLSFLPVLRRFAREPRGTVAIIFALALLPLFGLVGAAVDYTSAARVQAKLQAALDLAALSASSRAAGKTQAQVQADAQQVFNAAFQVPGVPTPTLNVQLANSTVTVSTNLDLPTNLLQVVGIRSTPIGGMASTAWGINRLRVALALDNTGSMASGNKIGALKTATLNLLSQLQAAATQNGDVYVSLIPFSRVVNVGTSSQGQNWLDLSPAMVSQTTCSGSGKNRECTTRQVLDWDGAVMDRSQPYDISNAAPGSGALFPATTPSAGQGTPVALMPLSYNWAAMRSRVNQMTPTGMTNQVIGLAWAWQSLTQGGPLNAPSEDPNYTYSKVVILLTDGVNTASRYASGRNAATQIDARQRQLCNAIKATGVIIYTIQIDTDGDSPQSVLRDCATSPDRFTYMTSATQLDGTFRNIGTQLTKLRLTN